jgi:hypothetical protein
MVASPWHERVYLSVHLIGNPTLLLLTVLMLNGSLRERIGEKRSDDTRSKKSRRGKEMMPILRTAYILGHIIKIWMKCGASCMPTEVCLPCFLGGKRAPSSNPGGYYFGSVDQER